MLLALKGSSEGRRTGFEQVRDEGDVQELPTGRNVLFSRVELVLQLELLLKGPLRSVEGGD